MVDYPLEVDPDNCALPDFRRAIKKITPLPNLDFKIRRANSLIEQIRGHAIKFPQTAADTSDFALSLSKLATAKHRFYEARRKKDKRLAQLDILEATAELAKYEFNSTKLKFGLLPSDQDAERAAVLDRAEAEMGKLQMQIAAARKKNEREKDDDIERLSRVFNDEDKPTFVWQLDFAEVFHRKNSNGFDFVMGNPPYSLAMSDADKTYLRSNYNTLHFKINLFACFIELGLRLLNSNSSAISFIVPNLLFANDSLSKLRLMMLQSTHVRELINCGDGVFPGVSVPTMLFIAAKNKTADDKKFVRIVLNAGKDLSGTHSFSAPQAQFLKAHNYVFETAVPEIARLLSKLKQRCRTLNEVLDVNQGVITGDDEKYLSDQKVSERFKPTIRGKDVGRYVTNYPKLFVEYSRAKLACPRTEDLFDVEEKILMRRTGDEPIASLDTRRCYNLHTLYSCRNKSNLSIKYLLGLVNSRLLKFIYRQRLGTEVDRTFAEIKIVYIRQLPIQVLDLAVSAHRVQHDTLVALVEQILSAKQSDAGADVCKLEQELDELVYTLYALTPSEIELVKGASK
jgi:hypothetical protein